MKDGSKCNDRLFSTVFNIINLKVNEETQNCFFCKHKIFIELDQFVFMLVLTFHLHKKQHKKNHKNTGTRLTNYL